MYPNLDNNVLEMNYYIMLYNVLITLIIKFPKILVQDISSSFKSVEIALSLKR